MNKYALALIYTYEDYENLLRKVSNGNIGIADECGEYFYTVSQEIGEITDKEIYSMLGEELDKVIDDIIIDIYHEKVAIICCA